VIAFVVVGRILIWALQTTPLLDRVRRVPKLQELLDCDFCLGFWVFSILALLYRPRVLSNEAPTGVQCVLTGLVTSFATHVARIGWEVRFRDAVHSA
jgi:hypothetical protein